MARVRSKNTAPELAVRRELYMLGVRYRIHVASLPGRPDIYIPRLKLAICINGCFWHVHTCKRGQREPISNASYWSAKRARNAERDQTSMLALRDSGIDTAVFWTCESDAYSSRCREIAARYHGTPTARPQ